MFFYTTCVFKVLYSLQNVNFTTDHRENVFFSKDGDSPAKYELINLQKFSKGTATVVTVGYYDASLPKDQQLTLNGAEIVWKGGSRMVFPVTQAFLNVQSLTISCLEKLSLFIFTCDMKVPLSVCSESCTPGTRRAVQKGRPACCFDCIQCAPGEISNTTGNKVQ